MGWGTIAAALVCVSLALAPVADAQPAETSTPSVTQHRLSAGKIRLSYRATAGLMPIRGDDGLVYGDMSYVSYNVATKRREKPRPIAFVWNGGPGSNSLPLHYGAFGPRRLAGDKLKPNAASLLDVADLVFVDQMETGFGRILVEGNVATAELDTKQFTQFVETWLRDNPRHGNVFLIGESYGVYRAVTVADLLRQHGVELSGLVLISGYPTVGAQLDQMLHGALRIPGFAAYAFTRGKLNASAGRDVLSVHDAALAWVVPLYEASTATENYKVGWPEFIDGLSRFTGIPRQDIAGDKLPIGSVGAPYAFSQLAKQGPAALFPDVTNYDMYDIRYPPDVSVSAWISRAVVEDIRKSLGLDLKRDYAGLEYDRRSPTTGRYAMAVPADGLAETTASPLAPRWRVRYPEEALIPNVLKNAPNMRVFIAGEIFDVLFSCALSEEMIRRDLPALTDRVTSQCYAGGHMMYLEEDVAAKLSADVRGFIRGSRRR